MHFPQKVKNVLDEFEQVCGPDNIELGVFPWKLSANIQYYSGYPPRCNR